jgi:hypothetical protein
LRILEEERAVIKKSSKGLVGSVGSVGSKGLFLMIRNNMD